MQTGLNNSQEMALQRIQAAYKQLGNKSIVHTLVGKEALNEWQHYPKGDVRDTVNHIQYYYHSHPCKDTERGQEHGHLHVFCRKSKIPTDASPIVVSDEYQQSQGEKDNLTHLIAVSMNEFGFPNAFFTVNHWVVLGAWYEADVLASILKDFKVENTNSRFAIVNQWLTNMVYLFQDNIIELLHKRDEVIESYAKEHQSENVFYDKKLEITSILPLE